MLGELFGSLELQFGHTSVLMNSLVDKIVEIRNTPLHVQALWLHPLSVSCIPNGQGLQKLHSPSIFAINVCALLVSAAEQMA